MIRVEIPGHLRTLAEISGGVEFDSASIRSTQELLDALEERYPVLRGTIREYGTMRRRAYVRFFACQQDISHEAPEAALPEAVLRGEEPFIVMGAMAGG